MADFTIYPDKEPSKTARALAEQIERDGGHVLAIYQEPVGEHWQVFCLLPRTKVEDAAWPVVKNKIFEEATEIFLRLLRGETLNSSMISPHVSTASASALVSWYSNAAERLASERAVPFSKRPRPGGISPSATQLG